MRCQVPLLSALAFASSVFALPQTDLLSHLASRANPIPPSQDPFYKAPAGFETKAPGTILRHRPVPYPITVSNETVLNVKASYQILYRTTDSLGKPQATVTTLLVPYNADPAKYLSYQIAYDSAYINCNPSYTLQKGSATHSNTTSSLEILLIAAALNQGWYVSTPDYEGDKAAFVAGPQAGQATLDGVRAVLRSSSFSKVSPKAKTAMWGYSGGSLASEWAAELQPDYAPELEFVGVAAGGLVPNVTSILEFVNKGSSVGLVPLGIIGLSHAYPNLSRYVDNHLVPAKAARFRIPEDTCLLPTEMDFANEDILTYFKNGIRTLTDPVPRSVLQVAGQQGLRATPEMPIYFYKAIQDEISPVADSDALVDKYCSKGARIHYVRDIEGNHGEYAIVGAPAALGWLKDRFDGVPVPEGCIKEQVAISSLSPDSIEVLGPLLFSLLELYLGGQSGPPFH